jgi:hypothetical protein
MTIRVSALWLLPLALAGVIQEVKAQSVALPPDSFLWSMLCCNERFLSNAVCVKGGRVSPCAEVSASVGGQNIESSRITFSLDSVQWAFAIADVPCSVSFPNDISLITGMDRKELIELMVQTLGGNTADDLAHCDTVPVDSTRIVQVRQGELMGVLQRLEFLVSPDSVALCNGAYPLESMVTELQRKEGCGCVPPLIAAVHGYGQRVDTLISSLNALMDVCDIGQMEVWTALEGNELTALLQHRYLGYNHMFFVRKAHKKDAWLADVYPFIPRHNVLNLFKAYVVKDGAQKLRIE